MFMLPRYASKNVDVMAGPAFIKRRKFTLKVKQQEVSNSTVVPQPCPRLGLPELLIHEGEAPFSFV